jgi:probable phosphoglycerate mutase
MSIVTLARHGRTAWHSPNRYTGRSDIPLDEVGERQAAALARWAAGQGFTTIASSDLRRAVATAAPVAEVTGLDVRTDPRLRELDFGIAEGLTLDAIDPDVAAAFVRDPVTHHFPEGEHPADAVARFRAGLAAVAGSAQPAQPAGSAGSAGSAGDGAVLVIAHSTIIRLIVCDALGVPLPEYRRRLPTLDPGATTTLRLTGDGVPTALLAYNVRI